MKGNDSDRRLYIIVDFLVTTACYGYDEMNFNFGRSIVLLSISSLLILLIFGLGATWLFSPDSLIFWISLPTRMIGGVFFVWAIILFLHGVRDGTKKLELQQHLENAKLQNSSGKTAQVMRVDEINSNVDKIRIKSNGVTENDLIAKKEELEGLTGCAIAKIERTDNPKYINMFFATELLKKMYSFEDTLPYLTKKYEFCIGESYFGKMTTSIRELPHLLIAGATGQGKSVFFKQLIAGLMLSSDRIQFYIMDLKGGLDAACFKGIRNVHIESGIDGSAITLHHICEELERRLKYLESKGHSKFNPRRDKMDLIVVGVDEASMLYSIQGCQRDEAAHVHKARKFTEKLIKQGRAAGVHIVAATQKVDRHSIPTQMQENFSARAVFMANTQEGSGRALGSSEAKNLPKIAGRGIWRLGVEKTIIQAHYISDEYIQQMGKEINKMYEEKVKKNEQEMIVPNLEGKTIIDKKINSLALDEGANSGKDVD